MDNKLEIDFYYNIRNKWVKSVRIVKSVSDWKNITEYTESWRRECSRLISTYTQLFRVGGREHNDLIGNTIHCCIDYYRKGAQWADR